MSVCGNFLFRHRIEIHNVRNTLCAAVKICLKMSVFWVVAPCSVVEVYQRFGGACCLHRQDSSSCAVACYGLGLHRLRVRRPDGKDDRPVEQQEYKLMSANWFTEQYENVYSLNSLQFSSTVSSGGLCRLFCWQNSPAFPANPFLYSTIQQSSFVIFHVCCLCLFSNTNSYPTHKTELTFLATNAKRFYHLNWEFYIHASSL
jgi:hypothetical protein